MDGVPADDEYEHVEHHHSHGPVQEIGSVDGVVKCGGLKIGEMEHYPMAAHGAAARKTAELNGPAFQERTSQETKLTSPVQDPSKADLSDVQHALCKQTAEQLACLLFDALSLKRVGPATPHVPVEVKQECMNATVPVATSYSNLQCAVSAFAGRMTEMQVDLERFGCVAASAKDTADQTSHQCLMLSDAVHIANGVAANQAECAQRLQDSERSMTDWKEAALERVSRLETVVAKNDQVAFQAADAMTSTLDCLAKRFKDLEAQVRLLAQQQTALTRRLPPAETSGLSTTTTQRDPLSLLRWDGFPM